MMKQNLSLRFFISLFIFAMVGPSYGATVHVYEVQGFPGDLAACQKGADIIAARFSAATGYAVISASCVDVHTARRDISISYESDIEATLVSTFDPYLLFQEQFRSDRDCNSALLQEQQLFERRTALKAVAAYCYREFIDDRYYYSVRIDGFGSPLMQPFVFHRSIYNSPEDPIDKVRESIELSLKQMPGVFEPRVFVGADNYAASVVVRYYGTSARALNLSRAASFENAAACRQYRGSLDRIFTEFGMLGVRSFCTNSSVSASSDLYTFGMMSRPFTVVEFPTRFSSRQQCESALPRAVEAHSRQHGGVRSQGICSYSTDDFLSPPAYVLKIIAEQ